MLPTTLEERRRLAYVPGLDGLRGAAVIAVLLFHSNFAWAKGGHLGVTTFFVLSGFLITTLLLLEHDRTGTIDLVGFWGRRVRRLVPAALFAVALITAYIAFSETSRQGLLADGGSALLWVANWRFIAAGSSYADMFSEPTPFRHFWSLAIEEQFYLVFPAIVASVFAFCRDRVFGRWMLGALLLLVALGSTELAALLHEPGDAPLRAYYGTDTRVAEPAIGCLLALLIVGRTGVRELPVRWRRVLDAAAVAAAAGLAGLMTSLSVWSPRLYDGGFLVAAILAAVLVAAATQPAGVVPAVLRSRPLVAVGRVSYGLYLYHWPVFLWIDAESTSLDATRLLMLRLAVTTAIAVLSYVLVERPVRAGVLTPSVGALSWATSAVALLAVLALATASVTWPAGDSPEEIASGERTSSATTPDEADGSDLRGSATGDPDKSTVAPQPVVATTIAPPMGAPAAPQRRERSSAATTVPGPPPVRYRIAFIGDSVSANLAAGMAAWGRDNGVEVLNLSILACPVSRGGERRYADGYPWPIADDCAWWADPASTRWRQLRAFAPDVIVVHDGLNEVVDRKLDQWPKWMRPGEPVFDTWLTGEYRALIREVADRRIGLALLNVPCADWDRWEGFSRVSDPDGRVRALNTIVYQEIGTSATDVLDLHAYLCPQGRYSDSVDGVADARPDGFHLSHAAAYRAAERFLAPAVLRIADREFVTR